MIYDIQVKSKENVDYKVLETDTGEQLQNLKIWRYYQYDSKNITGKTYSSSKLKLDVVENSII